MDSRELECFVAAIECGSINQAAKRVFVSPQGLGKVLRKLETELSCNLLERTPKGIEPTQEGRAFYNASKTLLADFDAVKKSVSTGDDEAIVLQPAFSFGVLSYLGIDTIGSFEHSHPGVRVEATELPDNQLDEAFRNMDAVFGVMAGPIDTSFYDARFLASIRHVAVLPQTHPLASRPSIRYADFDGKTAIMVSRQFKPYHNNMDRLLRAGAMPERVIEVGEIHLVRQYVGQGAGIGISVEFEEAKHPHPDTVVLPLEEDDCLWNLFVVHPNNRILSPIEMDFIEHLLARATAQQSDTQAKRQTG